MFKNILIPVSSEFYSKKILERSVFIAEKFKSTINLIYIIEEKTLQQTDKISDSFRTHYNRLETSHDIINKSRLRVDNIILNDAKFLMKNTEIPFKEKIVEGEFSSVVKRELDENNYDLVLMSYDRGCMIDYSLLDNITTPLWIEGGGQHESILAICSNLAPNQKVPKVSMKLSEAFKWKLSMLYIIDTQDTVEVDINGNRSTKKPKQELLFAGQNFEEEMQKNQIDVKTVQGTLEQQTIKEANKTEAGLIIIGRERKERGMLGFPVKKIKQKMAEKCKYSLLYLN